MRCFRPTAAERPCCKQKRYGPELRRGRTLPAGAPVFFLLKIRILVYSNRENARTGEKTGKGDIRMDCKTAEKLIPDFIRGRMETREAKHFLAHVEKCASCREELSIQFLVTVGMQRLEDGEAFNLNRELYARLAVAKRHVRIRERLQWGLYYFEALAVLAVILVMTTVVF